MKKLLALLWVLIVAAGCVPYGYAPLPAAQAASTEPRQVTVTGDAEVRVPPDEVLITLGVETWDTDLATARAANDDIVARALAVAEAQGIERRHLQTDYLSIEPRYRDSWDKSEFIGYYCRKTIVVTLRDVSRFEELLTALLEAGVQQVHGVQFRTTELRRHKDEARALAVIAAREKAAALAGELGGRIGEPLGIREEQSSWWSWYGAWWGARYGGGMAQNVIQEVGAAPVGDEGAPMAPGQIAVRAQVTVRFALD